MINFFSRTFQLARAVLIFEIAAFFTGFPLTSKLTNSSGNLYRACNFCKRSVR
jgi:hypothetical protein